MNKKQTILIFIIILALVFGLGILVGIKINPEQAGAPAAQDDLSVTGTTAVPELPEGMEIMSASGTTQNISDGIIALKLSEPDPLIQESGDTLMVRTDSDTKFYRFVQKDPARFQEEMADFQKKMQGEAATAPPLPYDKKEIALSDIKEGQLIAIMSDENIWGKKEFTAAEISVALVPVATSAE